MKQRDYVKEKEHKIKSTRQGLIILSIFIVIFMSMIIRLAIRRGSDYGLSNPATKGADAYGVARDYLKASMRHPGAEFSDDDFQYSQPSDSVYIVRSYFEVEKDGESIKTNFSATLQYLGGPSSDDHNWRVLSLNEK